jgi:hypothetical protein
MRLQVALAFAFLSLNAHADSRATAFVSAYSDDDNLTVVSPEVALRQELSPAVDVEASWEADIISAASVDVMTAASPRGFEETRHGVTAGVTWKPEPEVTFALKYLPTWENDYSSHGLSLRTGYEWLERRLEQRLDLRASFDRVGRSGEPESEWRDLDLVAVGPSVSYVVDRWTVASLAYELQAQSGFQASPYRFVPIDWSSGTTVSAPERHPEWRVRHALAVGVRHALSRRWFASAGYRFYRDSWKLSSHTADAGLQYATRQERAIVGLDVRGYYQGEASFYQERYAAAPGTLPSYRSRDKMLSENWSVLAGLRGEVGLGPVAFTEDVRLAARTEIYDQHFLTFEPLSGRRAFIFQLGATAEY